MGRTTIHLDALDHRRLMTTEQLLKETRHAYHLYRQAVKQNKPLSVILYWSNMYNNKHKELKHHTKWSLTRLNTEITGE